MDNKINNNFSEISKEEKKSVINSNIFDVIKSSIIFSGDIPNAYRLFTYFAKKNHVQWNEHGVIEFSGNKINLDIYKLLKYLTTRNMKISDDDDREDLKRLLYTAHPIKKFIKNSYIIRLMDGDSDIDDNDKIRIVITPTQPRQLQKRRTKLSPTNLSGRGLWTCW